MPIELALESLTGGRGYASDQSHNMCPPVKDFYLWIIFMSENKKYFYLKLKDNFFDRPEIKAIEGMQAGYEYICIIQKMYLRSLSRDGKLMLTDTIPYDISTLSSVLGHKQETIVIAIDIFKKMGLIEILSDNAIYMAELQSFIGESSTEADRIRMYRSRISTENKDKNIGGTNCVHLTYKCTPELKTDLNLKKELTSLSYPPSSDEDSAEPIFLNNQKPEEETPESTPKKETVPYVEIATLYNEYLGDILPQLRNPKNLPATVKSHIKARFKNQLPTITHWDSFYIRACESDFLTGKIMDKEGKYPSFCDFYWIIKEMNCEKILSGKYDNKEQSNQPKRAKPWEIV